jgi:putative endonuclease
VTPRALLERLVRTLAPGRAPRYRGLRGSGQRWEELAERRLKAEGYSIRDRNFRGAAGEIDLIAEEGGVLCFIEVKGRSGSGFGAPAEAVTLDKQWRIARAAEEYLKRKRLGAVQCRFDVVAILGSDDEPQLRIFRDAFSMPDARPRRR